MTGAIPPHRGWTLAAFLALLAFVICVSSQVPQRLAAITDSISRTAAVTWHRPPSPLLTARHRILRTASLPPAAGLPTHPKPRLGADIKLSSLSARYGAPSAATVVLLLFSLTIRSLFSLTARPRTWTLASTGAYDDAALLASLRARKSALGEETKALLDRWRTGKCRTTLGLQLGDWVRRLALDWPLAAVGSARGGVHIANLTTQVVVASAPDAHPAYVENGSDQMELLYGDFDGGGTTAIAFSGPRVVSAGRDGTAKVWRYTPGERSLTLLAALPSDAVPSCIAITEDSHIWTGDLKGRLRRWVAKSTPLTECRDYGCDVNLSVGAPVLCLAVDPSRGLLGCGTVEGRAAVYGLEDGTPVAAWLPHPGERVRSIAFAGGSVLTGGSDGTIRRQPLTPLAPGGSRLIAGEGDTLFPPHNGAVVGLLPHPKDPSLLVTAAIDSSIRIWDLSKPRPESLYGIVGYKVWLGSLAIDDSGRRLVSDGRDNLVVFHDFSAATPPE